MGLTEIYRLSPTLARDQSVWIVVGLLGVPGHACSSSATTAGSSRTSTRSRRRGRPPGRHDGGRARPSTAPSCGFGSAASRCSRASSRSCCSWSSWPSYLREHREVLTIAHRRILGVGLPAARHLGPLALMAGDLARRAGGDERPGHGAAALRHLPGDDLRRHRAAPLHGARPGALRRRIAGRCTTTVAARAASGSQVWIDPWAHAAHDRLPDRPVDRVDRRRRHLRHGPRPQPPGARATARRSSPPSRPTASTRPGPTRPGLAGRRRAAADLPALLPTAASRSRRSPTTASRSSSPAGSRSRSGSRRS